MKKFWALTPSAEADELDLTVYGYIAASEMWSDEVGAKQFREALDAHKGVKRINVRINSGGGEVFAGIAIHSMLQAHPAEVLVTVEGLAGSAASLIAMAGHVTIARGAQIMIHNVSTIVMGGADDLRHTADVLDGLQDSLIAIYRAKTGKTPKALRELLAAETWLTAEQAVEQGFADVVAGEVVPEARGEAVFFASVGYPRGRVPASVLAHVPAPQTEEPPKVEPQEEPVPLTREQLAAEAPDLLAAIIDEGRAEERARMQAIDEIAVPGHEALILSARYTVPLTAEALAVAILRAERESRSAYVADSVLDAIDAEVPAAPLAPLMSASDEEEIQQNAKATAAGARRVRR